MKPRLEMSLLLAEALSSFDRLERDQFRTYLCDTLASHLDEAGAIARVAWMVSIEHARCLVLANRTNTQQGARS